LGVSKIRVYPNVFYKFFSMIFGTLHSYRAKMYQFKNKIRVLKIRVYPNFFFINFFP